MLYLARSLLDLPLKGSKVHSTCLYLCGALVLDALLLCIVTELQVPLRMPEACQSLLCSSELDRGRMQSRTSTLYMTSLIGAWLGETYVLG